MILLDNPNFDITVATLRANCLNRRHEFSSFFLVSKFYLARAKTLPLLEHKHFLTPLDETCGANKCAAISFS